jgi:hypothetical protein
MTKKATSDEILAGKYKWKRVKIVKCLENLKASLKGFAKPVAVSGHILLKMPPEICLSVLEKPVCEITGYQKQDCACDEYRYDECSVHQYLRHGSPPCANISTAETKKR